MDFLREFHLSDSDRSYLETLTGADGKPLFETAFLDDLARLKLTCDIDAVPEGTVVFPQEPLVRVKGPLLEAQLIETALLNIINFQTLIATKGRPHLYGRPRQPRAGVRTQARSGHQRRAGGQPGSLRRWLSRHVKCPRR